MRRLIPSFFLLAGCAPAAIGLPPGIDVTPVRVRDATALRVAPSVVVSRTTIPGSALPTGLAVQPDTGQRLVLFVDGTIASLATGVEVFAPGLGAPATAPFGYTDVVALGGGELALTAPRDGYLVDVEAGSLAPHFCYEPGGWEEVSNEPIQVSDAVALAPGEARLYAQPRTIEASGYGATVGSFVAGYDLAGGADVAWWVLPDPGFVATGMAAIDGRLIIAAGATLHVFDPATAELRAAVDLAPLGVVDVQGLAIDGSAGTLLVLSSRTREAVELRLEALEIR